MNFDKLPCDIKSKIYNINKIAEHKKQTEGIASILALSPASKI